jgi:chloride channel 3/4/5
MVDGVDGDTVVLFEREDPLVHPSPMDSKLNFQQESNILRTVDFSAWIDITPMTVHPAFPVEGVLELFKKMGLRHVLVTRNGYYVLNRVNS